MASYKEPGSPAPLGDSPDAAVTRVGTATTGNAGAPPERSGEADRVRGQVLSRSTGPTVPRWRAAMRGALDAIYPPRCVGCRVRGHWLCAPCRARIEMLPLPLCGTCHQPLDPPIALHSCPLPAAGPNTLCAVGMYGGPLREAVHALKYDGRHGITPTLVALLAPRLETLIQDGDVLVPMPLHPSRERERGYNQCTLLAVELARVVPAAVDVAPAALRRIRRTAQQATLSGKQRDANVRGAFEADPRLVRGRRIWLLDDVYTSGATIGAAAQALHEAGAAAMQAAVVALAR